MAASPSPSSAPAFSAVPPSPSPDRPRLILTQGDPAGIGPEILLGLLARWWAGDRQDYLPVVVAEESAVRALRDTAPASTSPADPADAAPGAVPPIPWERLRFLDAVPERPELEALVAGGEIPLVDPVAQRRRVRPGEPTAADAHGALAALDRGLEAVQDGAGEALVTAPVSKESIARHALPGFAGHTEYLAERCGLEHYGRDYLMAFLAPDLQVALLSTHVPLRTALDRVTPEAILEALACLERACPGSRIAVAGVNPHAGEGGLLGHEDLRDVAPAVAAARQRRQDVAGPESADSIFARARAGQVDWVLALYHDQGLIAVKTAAFGQATNWTLGLPVLRTSVDHGTAFPLAGRWRAQVEPLEAVVQTTLGLLDGSLPRRREGASERSGVEARE